MAYKLSASILAADMSKLGDEIKTAERAGSDYIHIDIMDGVFVPNISFGIPVVRGLRKDTNIFFDIHLMIVEPIEYVERFAQAGADSITVHAEACEDLEQTIEAIIQTGKEAGVAISPDTDIDILLPVLDKVSMILVMTVYPGYGGQKIIKETFEKIRKLRKLALERNLHFDIEVDGGVSLDNISEILDAGANVFVAGSKVFEGNIEENIKKFKAILHDYK